MSQVLEEAQEIAVRDHNVEFKSNLWICKSLNQMYVFVCMYVCVSLSAYVSVGMPVFVHVCVDTCVSFVCLIVLAPLSY